MELNEMVRVQREFDQRHGWTPDSEDPAEVCNFLAKDLIGLFGEMGEFANIVKKLQLARPDDLPNTLSENTLGLEEELVDFLIYVLRFASHLRLDLEMGYTAKLAINEKRFRRFLRDASKVKSGGDRDSE